MHAIAEPREPGATEEHPFDCTECADTFTTPEGLGTHLERHRECPPAATTRKGKPLTRTCSKGCGRNVPIKGGRLGWRQHEEICDGQPPILRTKGAGATRCPGCGTWHLSSEACPSRPAPAKAPEPNVARPLCATCLRRHAPNRCPAEIPDVPIARGAADVPRVALTKDSEEETTMADTAKCPKCDKVYTLRGRGRSAFEAHKGKCEGPAGNTEAARKPRASRAARKAKPSGTEATAETLRKRAAELRAEAEEKETKAGQLEALADQVEEVLR